MSLDLSFKKAVWKACSEQISQKLEAVNQQLKEQLEASANEGKSTAGDKHETGRAMAQLEQEKTGNQLAELEKMQQQFQRLTEVSVLSKAGNGALLNLNNLYVYIAVPLGKIRVKDMEVMVISSASPMGALLIGKQKGDKIQLNGRESVVLDLI